jgi:hypothetical protein
MHCTWVHQVHLNVAAGWIAGLGAACLLLMPAAMNQNPKAKRAAAALFGIAGLLLVSILVRSWFSAGDGGIGLTGIVRCMGNHCESKLWFSIPHAPSSIVMLALVGLGAGFAAIGLLIHTGVMVLRGTPDSARLSGTTIALGVTMVAAIAFLLRIASDSHSGLNVSWAGFTCMAASIGGTIAIALLVRPLTIGIPAIAYAAPPPHAGGMQPIPAYPLTMQSGMTRMHGHVFLAPGRLYFICVKQGGAWMDAIGHSLGGAIGGALVGLAMPTVGGAPTIYDEAQLHQAVAQMPGSLVMDAPQIQQIKQTWAWRLIRFNGRKFGLPNGLGRDLKAALGPWARYHQVKTVGFA